MQTADFDYNLPEIKIAQEPMAIRDQCKLLCLDKNSGNINDEIFYNILDYLRPGDLLVANETRVRPARLLGNKKGSGGAAEIFLLRPIIDGTINNNKSAMWECLVRPGKRLKPGSVVEFKDKYENVILEAEIIGFSDKDGKGQRKARLSCKACETLDEAIHIIGNTPLPPYIKNYSGDSELYQTIYSARESSAAAPTAGLHFTQELINKINEKGIDWTTVELQVGLDTFRTVEVEDF